MYIKLELAPPSPPAPPTTTALVSVVLTHAEQVTSPVVVIGENSI